MGRITLIAFLCSSACLFVVADVQAACKVTDAVYRLSDDKNWELRLPMRDEGRPIVEFVTVPMVTLYSKEKNKTYQFGWVVSNNIPVEQLVPLWLKEGSSSRLRVYQYANGELINGLPSKDEPAPDGIFVENIDLFFYYDVDVFVDQAWVTPGIWKLAACDRS